MCIRDRYVGTKRDRIDYIGDTMPEEDYGEVYEGAGKLLMSGFFNSHAHTPMTLMRGYGESMSCLLYTSSDQGNGQQKWDLEGSSGAEEACI